MSDFRGIGGVSATLRTLLADRMELPDGIPTIPVTVGLPPFTSKDNDPHKEDPRLNIFLYRVTENGHLQNQDIPGRAPGSSYGHPPLSLNLHYLITAYGNLEVAAQSGALIFDDTTAHFVLGSAMRVLHDVPVVTPRLTTTRPPSGNTVLHPSLRDEIESIRSTIEPLTLEDITKIWTALSLRYRVSASYVVNVVRIESRRRPRIVRPVDQPLSPTAPPLPTDAPTPGPMVHVLTISTPTITDLRVRRLGVAAEHPFPYARIGDTLVLRGTNLSGPMTSVKVGEVVVPASLALADRVEAVIPDATVLGGGAIPLDLLLQPGVRTASIVVRNPLVPQRAFTSNEAAFMLVPAVNPATLAYVAGPPRTLTIQGSRLVVAAPVGEALIGRAIVPRSAYITATPAQIVVPVPDELPTRGVHVIVGAPLSDPIPIGAGVQSLTTTIAGTSATLTANLPASIPRSSAAGIVAQLIHDAAPQDPRFTATRVGLWGNRLVIVPGGLTHTISITSGGSTLAAALGLTAAQPPGAASAAVSGALGSAPVLSAVNPRVRMKVGAQPPIVVNVPRALSLDDLATQLEAAINGASAAAEYAAALVATTGVQLLVIPGAAGAVSFDPAPGDDTTAGELQLHARFAVRVRVNGAESVDEAFVELPQ